MSDRVQWGGDSSGGRRKAFADFIYIEIERSVSQRSSLEKSWRGWLEQYRAPITKGVAHFPFEGASDRTYPLTAMNVDPIWARFMQNIHAADNLWSLAPLNERWVDVAKPIQDFLAWIDKHILHMWDVNMRVLPEAIKLGTSVYKTGWRYEARRTVGYDASKTRVRKIDIINQPYVDHVSIANLLLPPEAREIDPEAQGGAQWVAERHRLRPAQLRAMAVGQEPFLPNFDTAAVEKVLKFEEYGPTEHEEKIRTLDQLGSSFADNLSRPIELWEVHARFDTTGNGIEDDVVVFYHKPSSTILRATYEPLPFRPYTAVRYLRGDGFYGIGIGEQMEMWQDAMSDVVNFNIDRVLLTNTPLLAVREGSSILPNEPFFPGKVLHVGDPKNDIVPFWLASNSSFDVSALINFFSEGAKQRSGMTDLQWGTVGALPSRTPATTVQSLLQEGNTRFDMSMKDIRGALSEVGLRVLQHLQVNATDTKNNPEGGVYVELAARILGVPEGDLAALALQIPDEAVELGVGVNLTATSSVSNKELMRQSNLALLQLFAQLGPQFIQLAMMAQQGAGTPVGEIATQLFIGGRELFARVLEQFDVRNQEDILPNVQALVQASQQFAQGGVGISPLAQQAPGGGAYGAQGF